MPLGVKKMNYYFVFVPKRKQKALLCKRAIVAKSGDVEYMFQVIFIVAREYCELLKSCSWRTDFAGINGFQNIK